MCGNICSAVVGYHKRLEMNGTQLMAYSKNAVCRSCFNSVIKFETSICPTNMRSITIFYVLHKI